MRRLILLARLSLFALACFLVRYVTPFSAQRKRGFSIEEHDEYFKKLEANGEPAAR